MISRDFNFSRNSTQFLKCSRFFGRCIYGILTLCHLFFIMYCISCFCTPCICCCEIFSLFVVEPLFWNSQAVYLCVFEELAGSAGLLPKDRSILWLKEDRNTQRKKNNYYPNLYFHLKLNQETSQSRNYYKWFRLIWNQTKSDKFFCTIMF